MHEEVTENIEKLGPKNLLSGSKIYSYESAINDVIKQSSTQLTPFYDNQQRKTAATHCHRER